MRQVVLLVTLAVALAAELQQVTKKNEKRDLFGSLGNYGNNGYSGYTNGYGYGSPYAQNGKLIWLKFLGRRNEF